jgi:hypothetical protein
MTVEAVVEVTSYELSAAALADMLKIPEGYKALALPMATPDGLPNHAQVLVLKEAETHYIL